MNPTTGLTMQIEPKTKQQLLLENEKLRAEVEVAQKRLREADELVRDQISRRRRVEETFEQVRHYALSIVETIRESLLVPNPRFAGYHRESFLL